MYRYHRFKFSSNANLYSELKKRFSPHMNKPFIVSHYTYDELDKQTAKYQQYFQSKGFKKNDRVAVQTEKCVDNAILYFACLRAGLIYLPLNTAYKTSELRYFLDDANPSILFADKKIELDEFKTTTFESVNNELVNYQTNQDLPPVVCSESDIAVLLYTSGTTGKAKGAMLTHKNLKSNLEMLSMAWNWQHEDILLHALPLYHVHGLLVALQLAVYHGSALNWMNNFNAENVCKLLKSSTVFMGVPTYYVRLLQQENLNESLCQNMRLFVSGSAPLLTDTFKSFEQKTSMKILERYGMTETGMNISNPINGERKPGTIGFPLPGVQIQILNDQGEQCEIKQPGKLLVKGDNVFKGYWKLPQKTKEEFTDDGFFITGDIASIDEDGYVSIVGRSKDMIISGGLNVYPKEIEQILDDFDNIEESAVFGVPHDDFGEAVTAAVVKKGEITEKEIISSLKQNLAGFKVPKRIIFLNELPRNAMGKVQKNVLRDSYKNK